MALYTERLLPADLKVKMFTPALEHYAYGWVVQTVPPTEPGAGKTMIQHEGGINGFNTLEQRLVDDHVLIVLLNNTPGVNLAEMARGIRTIVYGQEAVLPKRPLVTALGDTIGHRGVEATVGQYRELARNNRADYDFAEPRLNELGYMLLQRDRTADAITNYRKSVALDPKNQHGQDRLKALEGR